MDSSKTGLLRLVAISFFTLAFCEGIVAGDDHVRTTTGSMGAKVTHATWQQHVTEIPAKPHHEWRHTKLGWQQVPLPQKPAIHEFVVPEKRPSLHPCQAAVMILFLTLAAIVWSCDEWNWSRLVNEENAVGRGSDYLPASP